MFLSRVVASVLVASIGCLAGCKTLETDAGAASPVNAELQTDQTVADTQGIYKPEAAEKSSPIKDSLPTDTAAVQNLLTLAEKALADDRLTTPDFDNALDRYQAVLLLSPDHPQAFEGIKQIQLRYLDMARQAAKQNQFGLAESYLNNARAVSRDGAEDNELALEVENLIQQTRAEYRRRQAAAPPIVVPEFDGTELKFDPRALQRREESVVERLRELALDIQDSGETLLIIARNDAEGRWIYKVMNEAVPDMRLRGDIKFGRQPKIQLLPPIE